MPGDTPLGPLNKEAKAGVLRQPSGRCLRLEAERGNSGFRGSPKGDAFVSSMSHLGAQVLAVTPLPEEMAAQRASNRLLLARSHPLRRRPVYRPFAYTEMASQPDPILFDEKKEIQQPEDGEVDRAEPVTSSPREHTRALSSPRHGALGRQSGSPGLP
ncbi:hypothetical protein MDA_GLEAN10011209 [Myotis davidii]|uniref:Uncharacterized protein n=1 Tax=Myotis davidii TaxID=225400 RepID=L5MGD1_MYODS|nr:hypothetical protein MDA_GLEAN10011209 [Myotis davidii]